MPVDVELPVSLLVPPETTRLSTEEARKVLPDSVPRADALFNTSRAAVLMLALAGRPDLLMAGTEDRLHQEYRRRVLPASMAVMDSLRAQGYPANEFTQYLYQRNYTINLLTYLSRPS